MFPLIRWDSINDISQGLFITFPQIRRGERGLKVKNFSDKGPLFHDKGAMMPLGLGGSTQKLPKHLLLTMEGVRNYLHTTCTPHWQGPHIKDVCTGRMEGDIVREVAWI